jgi:hypothetical protein
MRRVDPRAVVGQVLVHVDQPDVAAVEAAVVDQLGEQRELIDRPHRHNERRRPATVRGVTDRVKHCLRHVSRD